LHPVIAKTFGGLSKPYYFRHFVFGLLIVLLLYFTTPSGAISFSLAVLFTINVFLYPYSRFVYESIVDFITGDNWFILPAVLMLAVKFITMILCFFFAIFIAPIGLAYLYYYHSKQVQEEG